MGRNPMRVAILLLALSVTPPAAAAQALLNSFFTVAMQRCLAAVETGTAPRSRTLFPGTPAAGILPQTMFDAASYWMTADGRIYLAADPSGNCAAGDTLAGDDAQAHATAIAKFEAWFEKENAQGRYIDTGLEAGSLAYRRTVAATGWSGEPILVTLVSDPGAGLLALIAERSEIVPETMVQPDDPASNIPRAMPDPETSQ